MPLQPNVVDRSPVVDHHPVVQALPLLPAGWKEYPSRQYGVNYYVKDDTSETTWERPVVPACPQENPCKELLPGMPPCPPAPASAANALAGTAGHARNLGIPASWTSTATHTPEAAVEQAEEVPAQAGNSSAAEPPAGKAAPQLLKGETLDCYTDAGGSIWFLHEPSGAAWWKSQLVKDGWVRYRNRGDPPYWWCREATDEYFYEQEATSG